MPTKLLAGVATRGSRRTSSSASPRRAAATASAAIRRRWRSCGRCAARPRPERPGRRHGGDRRVPAAATRRSSRLATATSTGDTYIDITHESLIRQWRRLRDDWLPAEQQSAKAFLTLAERARNWDAGKAEPLAGLDLAGALEWHRRRNPTVAWVEHYGDAKDLELVLRFIAASRVHDRKLRLRKRGLWIALPLLFVFALLAGVAVWQGFEQTHSAKSRAAARCWHDRNCC